MLRNLLETADLEDVDRIIVAGEAGEVVIVIGVLPRLRDGPIVEWVCLVRPDAIHEARLLLLVIVKDGI